jgi:hypothetical protein
MVIFSWLMAMVVALLATSTIVMALPRSAADELSIATVPQTMFSADYGRMTMMLASCVTDAD